MNEEDQQQAYDDIYGDKNKDDKSGLDKAADTGKKVKKAGKLALNLGKLASTPLGWIILGIIGVIVLLLLLTGLISFFQTMPGLILGKIEELGKGIWADIVKLTTGNEKIWNDQVAELAEYIEDMGYSLYEFGFGKPIYDDDGNIKKMDSEYESPLVEYILADKRTYSGTNDTPFLLKINPLVSTGRLISSLARGDGATLDDNGMIHIDDQLLGKCMTVDFENKQLITTNQQGINIFHREKYVYSLDGWTGRYGMPQSFTIALHLATMKPDLVTTMINEFRTKVYIDKSETKINLSAKYKTADGTEYDADTAYNEGYIDENLRDYIKNGLHDEIEIFQPYIEKVTDHWYYKTIDFSDAYETVSESGYSNSYEYTANSNINEDAAKKIENNTGSDGDKGTIIVTETVADGSKRRVQVRQPEIEEGANEKIKEIFKGKPNGEPAKYYTYDGTIETADAIEEARKNKDDSLKKEVSFDKKDALEAFSILENCKDLDSQYIYRNLKKLLIELEYFTEEDFATPDTLVLKWILSGYKPPKWPQREDEYSYGAILYSKSTADKEEVGFEAEKSVTSPGKGIISKISEDSITIKFTEPEVVLDFSMKISGFKVNEDLKEGDTLEKGAEIGKTTDSDIRMILKDAKGSIIDHIEDYISPKKVAFDSDNALFYWTVYESYGYDLPGHGPESAAISDWSPNEMAVGIAQWTTLKDGSLNNVREFCKWAYQTDPILCAELGQFQNIGASDAFANINNIKAAFTKICERDREGFLQLQMAKKMEEYTNSANEHNASWLLEDDQSSILKGSIMAMWNYGSGIWTDRIKESNSDLENIKIALGHATSYASTAGSLKQRWESQFALARDALEGIVSEEDLENWVRNGASTMPQYGIGECPGVLDGYIIR